MRSRIPLSAALLVAATLAGCATTAGYDDYYGDRYYRDRYYDDGYYGSGGTVIVAPPLRSEYRGVPPYPNYIWMDGYWDRIGTGHHWVPGYWAPPGTRYHDRRLRNARERERELALKRERDEARERDRKRAEERERERRREDDRQRERWRDDVRERERRLNDRPTFSTDPEERRGTPGRRDFERRDIERRDFERRNDGRRDFNRSERPRDERRERALQPDFSGGSPSAPGFAPPVPRPRTSDAAPVRVAPQPSAAPVAPRGRGSRESFGGGDRPSFGADGSGFSGGGGGGGGASFGSGGNN